MQQTQTQFKSILCYAYWETQSQTPVSNLFQVLRNILKPSQTFAYAAQTSKQTSCNYVIKAHLMKVWILESHHFSKFGSLDITKIFSKGFFFQNDLVKTRKFYEYILIDTDFVEITHILNKDSTYICYSKCKIFKNLVGIVS